MADIFGVVADGTRRDILHVLLEQSLADDSTGDMSVSQIVSALSLSQPTVSKHLKVLREASLVTVREEGQRRFYRLNAEPLEEVEDWLIPFLSVGFSESDGEAGPEPEGGAQSGSTAQSAPPAARAAATRLGEAIADLRHALLKNAGGPQ